MKRQKILGWLIVGLLLISIPSMYERWTIEWNQNSYEIVLPYEQLQGMIEGSDSDYVLDSLNEAGLTGVLFSQGPDGYPKEMMDHTKQAGLEAILSYDPDHTLNDKKTMAAIASHFSQDEAYLHMQGEEVPGYPEKKQMDAYASLLQQGEDGIYITEFQNYQGLPTFSEQLEYDVIRMHDLGTLHGRQTMEEKVDRTIRAVKERNQRSILLSTKEEPSMVFTLEYLSRVKQQMPEKFSIGDADGIPSFTPSLLSIYSALFAGVLFMYFSLGAIFRNRRWGLLAVAPLFIAMGYLWTGEIFLLQGFALMVALATPIFAVRATTSSANDIKKLTVQFAKALGITFAGIAIIISLLNGTVFLAGIELFRGVKLLYIVPLLFFIIMALRETSWKKLIHGLKWWHFVLVGIIGLFAFYYVLRSGNAQHVPEWELLIRSKLEEWLYARPRTKEFLIGIPAYMLALFMMDKHKWLGQLMLVPGVIGFMSIVNTFTHLHIPLYLSLLRTGYSIVFGYLIGLVAIKIYSIISRK